jgi:hypothetical protein
MKRVILSIMAFTSIARADTLLGLNDHDWAHLAGSYAVQTLSYGLLSEVFDPKKEHRVENVICSAILTNMITTGYMRINSTGATNRDLLTNLAGQAVGVGAIFAFHF